jgi:ABC-2 type transport system ATP-binding protein
MEATFRSCVREMREQGRTVLLSSHILSEAEALSDRVSIIRDGAVVETGTLAELRHLRRTTVTARLRETPAGLGAIPGVHDVTAVGDEVTAQVDPAAMGEYVAALAGGGVVSLVSAPPTLEDLFLSQYGTATP